MTAEKSDHACVLILGGSFDPVHHGHVALAQAFIELMHPTQLRLIPAGRPPLKAACQASAAHRVAMLSLAFAKLGALTPVFIDKQEIERARLGEPSYSVDTLSALRNELGPSASLVLLIGADQLHQLHRWKNWPDLFSLAHLGVASRLGFNVGAIDNEVAHAFQTRLGSIEQLKTTPCGHTYIWPGLAVDMSSTEIRRDHHWTHVPTEVRDYIQHHHLYERHGS